MQEPVEKTSNQKIEPTALAAACGNAKISIVVKNETDSTNADALKMLRSREKTKTPFVVFANRQNAGTGRAGHTWESENCGNIYASFGFAPDIAPQKMANFTTWLGARICKMIAERFEIPAKVKWPNDLWIGGKKFSGTLTEADVTAKSVRGVVYGIGLNVFHVPENLKSCATALAECVPAGTELDLNFVAAELVKTVLAAAEQFFAGTFSRELSEIWPHFDLLSNKRISAVFGNTQIVGTARGIDENGNLLIEISPGTITAFSAGDIRIIREN